MTRHNFLILALVAVAVHPFSSVLHPAQQPIYKVLLDPPTSGGVAQRSTAHAMMDGSGRRYTCSLPAPPQATEGEEEQGRGGGGGRKLVQAVLEALAAAAPPAGAAPCAQRHEGYWSYEACLPAAAGGVAGSVRQWHSPGPSMHPHSEHSLGAHAPSRDALEYTPHGVRYLAQRFQDGTGGRSSEVRWVCSRGWGGSGAAPVGGTAAAAPVAAAAAPGASVQPPLELLSVAEAPPLHYTLVVGSRSERVCELLPSPQTLLAPLNHTCVEYFTGGWWTYELCLGRALRQFHAEGPQRLQDTVLGVYDWVHGERLVRKGEDVGVGGSEGGAATAQVFPVKATSALTQLYAGGSPCDIRRGMPRSALVRFECSGGVAAARVSGDAATVGRRLAGGGGAVVGAAGAGAANPATFALLAVEESPTCLYTFTVSSSLVCEHPAVGPSSELALPPPIHDVVCTSVQ